MLLAMAVRWGTSHVTSENHATQYINYMQAYLECIKDIFPDNFSPLICQSVFPPEHAVTPLPLTQHKIFPPEDVPITEAEEVVQTRNPISQTKVLIHKPRGEVSRINHGSYNLCNTLGWPAADYEEICINNSSHIAWTA